MKQFLSIILLLIASSGTMNAQVLVENTDQVDRFKELPREGIFIHFNSSLLLTGEYLYYKVYCLNARTNQLSDLSKIAYVELVGKDGKEIFKHKIKLENEQGSGDFFIPVSVPSGSYKLLGYTKWMQNGNVADFFQNDIHIINPYLADQSAVQTNGIIPIDTIRPAISAKKDRSRKLNKEADASSAIDLILEKENYGKRSKVSMILTGLDQNPKAKGDLSISIRKKGIIPEPDKFNTVQYLENYKSREYQFDGSNQSKVFLPELRGELLSGRIIPTDTDFSVKNLKVAVSIPGEHNYFAIAKTNEFGHFYVNIDRYYSGDEILLQVLDENILDFKIVLDQPTAMDYSDIPFSDLEIDASMKEEILKRSIHNQIENAYFKYKPDSVLSVLPFELFKNKKGQTYVLDDYTRFKTVRETIFEFVKHVFIRKGSKDNSVLRVQGYDFNSNTGILPLVLIDAFLVQDHNALFGYDARRIEKITIYRDQLVIGPQIFQGAIVLKTIDGINEDLINEGSIVTAPIIKPQVNKNYFKQRYDIDSNKKAYSRIPDDRYQLLWIPQLNLLEKEVKIDFFTSDVTGEFEICIEGFLGKQKPISIRKSLYVK